VETPVTDHRRATAQRNVQAILDSVEVLLERREQPSSRISRRSRLDHRLGHLLLSGRSEFGSQVGDRFGKVSPGRLRCRHVDRLGG
jgi:hypothetical protein